MCNPYFQDAISEAPFLEVFTPDEGAEHASNAQALELESVASELPWPTMAVCAICR